MTSAVTSGKCNLMTNACFLKLDRCFIIFDTLGFIYGKIARCRLEFPFKEMTAAALLTLINKLVNLTDLLTLPL